jgi:hypothetical protein
VTARWGDRTENRPPAVLECTHPALTVALVIVLLFLAAGLGAGVAG